MRWCRFSHDSKESYGIIEGDEIVPVSGNPFGDYRKTPQRLKVDAIKFMVPCIPPTFYSTGANYVDHAIGMAKGSGRSPDPPKVPYVTNRTNNALIAHGEPIIVPPDASDQIQYEAELVVVIGKHGKNLTEENALDYVLGYTIGNDFTDRAWQRSDKSIWRAKNSDTYKPMGPWIETNVDLAKMQTTVRVNGRTVTKFPTGNMIFGVTTYLAAITKYVTVYPGDVLWMGTDQVPENVKRGDVIEIELTGIGTLRNPVAK